AATVDAVLTGAGGFRMGPFALMDLIGHDVNEAVTRQVWSALGHDPRFEPSLAQRALVEGGWLGRKSGRGAYDHSKDGPAQEATPAPPSPPPAGVIEHGESGLGALFERAGVPVTAGEGAGGSASGAAGGSAVVAGAVELPGGGRLIRCDGTLATEHAARLGAPVVVVDRTLDDAAATAVAVAASDGCPPAALAEAVGLLQAAGLAVHVIDDTPGLIVTRTVAMLVNVAVDALARGVADAADIDAAMRLGTNYPLGPLAWGDRWGAGAVLAILSNLQATYGDGRYRPSPLLRRRALAGAPLAAPSTKEDAR
ncbi:MAG TPA: 3-hydroxyacyl-CoA dehydrogenase family protein, partial [Acidimicrobiales bacterium]|nr:3-hydroxyacyl-CoA dehydrogenase family protein [Acidimicrobiales bacterium]